MPGLILPSRFTQQPQQAARLDRSNLLTQGALAIVDAVGKQNLVSGIPLASSSTIAAKTIAGAGQAFDFNLDSWLETEILPAIGLSPYVEFWYGYPSVTSNGNQDFYASFVTGSKLNQSGIYQRRVNGPPAPTWGALNSWDAGANTWADAGRAAQYEKLTLFVAVRSAATFELYENGVLVNTVSIAPKDLPADTLIIGSFIEDTTSWATKNRTLLAGRIKASWAAQDVRRFADNPWQIFKAPARRIWVASAGAPAGTAVDPAVGTVALTGYAPTVAQTLNQSLTPGVGSMAITGYAPTIAQPQVVGPGAGSLAITGYAPTVTQAVNQAVNPNVGTVAITGYAPVIAQTANQAISPNVGSLSITGYAPSVVQASASQNILPSVGSLTITGYAPSVAQSGQTNFGGVPFFHSEYANKYRTKRAEEKEVVVDETPAVEPTVTAEPDAVEIEDVIGQVAAPSTLSRAKAKAKRELQAELKRQEAAYQKFHAKQLEEQLYQQAEEQRNAQFIQELQMLIQKDLEEQDEEEAMLLLM